MTEKPKIKIYPQEEPKELKPVVAIDMTATHKEETPEKIIETRYAISQSELVELRNLNKMIAQGIINLNRKTTVLAVVVTIAFILALLIFAVGYEKLLNVFQVGIKVRFV